MRFIWCLWCMYTFSQKTNSIGPCGLISFQVPAGKLYRRDWCCDQIVPSKLWRSQRRVGEDVGDAAAENMALGSSDDHLPYSRDAAKHKVWCENIEEANIHMKLPKCCPVEARESVVRRSLGCSTPCTHTSLHCGAFGAARSPRRAKGIGWWYERSMSCYRLFRRHTVMVAGCVTTTVYLIGPRGNR